MRRDNGTSKCLFLLFNLVTICLFWGACWTHLLEYLEAKLSPFISPLLTSGENYRVNYKLRTILVRFSWTISQNITDPGITELIASSMVYSTY